MAKKKEGVKQEVKHTKSLTDKERVDICHFVLDEIANNSLSLRNAVKKASFEFYLPKLNRQTVDNWFNEFDLVSQYTRARELRADNIFDEILDIVDKEDDDITIDIEGNERVNNDVIQRDRLRMDARKWMLSKMNPKKYGDKLDVTSDGEKVVTTIINLGQGTKPEE